MNNLKINHLAVWICIILMHAFGFLWYGPLFGEEWMALVNIDQATMEQGSMNASIWILNSVAIIAPIYLLAWVFTKMNVTSGIQGALIAFLIVFCFHHLPLMNANMFAGEPYGLAWITGGYSLTWLTVSGYILGAWTKGKP
jgi:Protein of unknown function (DUF1761)